ncbi:hypothetical protein [Aquamicrobium soli]|uniref:Uncharacterized protein n=1 Tax=Aquamicrobium soli TaxID=1811518 RepID=A0ABV7K5S5_9HYPH
MGVRTLRRLLIIGFTAVVRWAKRKDVPYGFKPPMLVIVGAQDRTH